MNELQAVMKVLDEEEALVTLPFLRRKTSLPMPAILRALEQLRKEGAVQYSDDDSFIRTTRPGKKRLLVLRVVVHVLDREERPATLPILCKRTCLTLSEVIAALECLRAAGHVTYNDDDARIYPTRAGRALVPVGFQKLSDILGSEGPESAAGQEMTFRRSWTWGGLD